MHTTSGENTVIDWQYDEIEQTFARARLEHRPVFLYWGVGWCPDCAQVRDSILGKPEFVERARRMVPIYLDGDNESAQKHGQRLGVFDYPTMVLFAPDGTEITRFPTNIPLARFIAALDAALAVMIPVSGLLERLQSGLESPLDPHRCRMLAWYTWQQDVQRVLSRWEALKAFSVLESASPAQLPVERSRFYIARLDRLLASEQLQESEREQAVQKLTETLATPGGLHANPDLLVNRPGLALHRLSRPGTTRRRKLEIAWGDALDALEVEPGLSGAQSMYITRARLRILRADRPDAPVTAELYAQIMEKVRWIQTGTQGDERQAAINAVANTLIEAGVPDQVKSCLVPELENSPSPFYLMNKLARAEAACGHSEASLEWLRRAHEQARGPATRFQWGVNRVLGLLDTAPQCIEEIRQTAADIISELGQSPDPFHNRNLARLEQLENGLTSWNAGGDQAHATRYIRSALLEVCNNLSPGMEAPAACRRFLAADAAADHSWAATPALR